MNLVAITKALGEVLQKHFGVYEAKLSALREELLAVVPKEGAPGPRGEAGAAGKDAPAVAPDVVAEEILATPGFLERVKGADGAPGKDAAPAPEAVAAAILATPGFVVLAKGDPGAPGKDAPELSPAAVAAAFLEAPGFLELVKGEPGADAEPVSAEAVADVILATPAFGLLVKGDPGDPGTPGDPGDPGAAGRDGNDGLGLQTLAWLPDSVHRAGAFVTHAHGKVYKALRDTASKPGSADWERIGSIGFEFKGIKSDEQYEEGDIYVDGGSAFLVTKGRGRLLAGRGKDGRDGDRGEAGLPAPRVVAVKASADSLAFAFDDGAVEEASLEGLGLWSDETLSAKVYALAGQAAMTAREELRDLILRCADFAQLQREIKKW